MKLQDRVLNILYPDNMKLPVDYHSIAVSDKWKVRKEYIKLQYGKCYHCKNSLEEEPTSEMLDLEVDESLFPEGFFKYPVHLHHSHETGLTIGAVHCYCNAVLWIYHGE